ncbi:hypothetical protein HK096_000100 [Nowakowskiella sp. JEL0078]|nr:hypothetical protein HK096_000100 [Nowakowskiella sp. JEL0078]
MKCISKTNLKEAIKNLAYHFVVVVTVVGTTTPPYSEALPPYSEAQLSYSEAQPPRSPTTSYYIQDEEVDQEIPNTSEDFPGAIQHQQSDPELLKFALPPPA